MALLDTATPVFQIADYVIEAGPSAATGGANSADLRAAAETELRIADLRAAAETELRIADLIMPRAVAPSERPIPGARAVVGGVEYTVGGWGEYEICRRRAQWELRTGGVDVGAGAESDMRHRYNGCTHVTAADAVNSILRGARVTLGGARAKNGVPAKSALNKAALALARELGRLEDKLCSPDDEGVWECVPPGTAADSSRPLMTTVPALTSVDLRAFAADPDQEADPTSLLTLGDDVVALAASLGLALPDAPTLDPARAKGLPSLPARVIPISDEEGVLRLESAVAPYVASVEELQAALASRLDAAATVLRAALAR
jgi:hypothetical protein